MALTQNQLDEYFKPLGRTATPYEYEQYKGADMQKIIGIPNFYNRLNKDSSIVDYLKYSGMDASDQNRYKLAQQYGIQNIGSAEGNTALLNALRNGQGPQGGTYPVGGAVSTAAGSPTPIDPTQGQPKTTDQSGVTTPTTPEKSPLDQAHSDYVSAQGKVNDIDKTLAGLVESKKKDIAASGGIVDEAQLKSLIYQEQAPLVNMRKDLVNQQKLAQENLRYYQSEAKLQQQQQQFQDRQANAEKLVRLRAELQGSNQDVSPELAQAINEGRFDASKISSRSIKIYNDLAKMNVDAISSSLNNKARSQIVTQAVKYQTAAKISAGVLEANMPILIALADKVNVNDTPGLNRAFIQGKKFTSSDPDVAKYASILETVRSEYATLLSKGGVSTESTREDAVHAIPAGLTSNQYTELLHQLEQESVNIQNTAQQTIDSALSPSQSYNSYSTKRDNNPLNVTLGAATQKYIDSGQATVKYANGLQFLAFKDPAVGLQASKDLLTSGSYSNLSIEDALRKWSGGDYGAEASPNTPAGATIGTLSQTQLNQLVNDMIKREGGVTGSQSTEGGQGGGSGDIKQYKPITFDIPNDYDYNYNRDYQQAEQAVASGADPASVWGHFNSLYK